MTIYADIGDRYGLSIETAIKLFELKLLPQVSYGLGRLREHLTIANFRTLEKSFTVFVKRTLRSSKSRYVYLMADTIPMVETIRARVKGRRTQAFEGFIFSWKEKTSQARVELSGDPILIQRSLRDGPANQRRHIFTRYLAHGYNGHLRQERNSHQAENTCVCRHCGLVCTRNHALWFPMGISLTTLAQMI